MHPSCTTAPPPNRWAARPETSCSPGSASPSWSTPHPPPPGLPPPASRRSRRHFTQAAELHGRPVAYLVTTVGKEEPLPPDGEWALVDRAVLDHTFNTLLVQEGVAYPTVHASTPVAHRGYLRDLAAETRKTGAGVWADDTSAEFAMEDQASIGPKGQLILPRLFRRATDYLEAVAGGCRGNLADWLVAASTSPSRGEDDRVMVCGRTELRLSDLLVQANGTVRFQADPRDVVFLER